MYLKTLIAAIIVAAIVSGLAFTVNLNALFPDVLALFIVSLLGGCLTSVWVDESESIPAKPRKKTRKPTSGRPTSDRPTTSKETGSVKWFSPSKGFGFITRDNGDDIFVHFRSILGKGHRVLREGQRVEFAVTEGSKGLQAEDVDTIN